MNSNLFQSVWLICSGCTALILLPITEFTDGKRKGIKDIIGEITATFTKINIIYYYIKV